MKPIYKCDYCTHTGIESDVAAHESVCPNNYNRKHCGTCKNVSFKGLSQLACSAGIEIPAGQYIENCTSYERDNGQREANGFEILFRAMYGGM